MCLSENQLLLAVDNKEDSSLWNDPTNLKLVVYSITERSITHRINLPLSTISSPILYTYPRQSISQIPLAQTAGTFAPDPSLDIFTLEFWPNDGLNAPCIVVFSTLGLLKACDAATLQGEDNYPMVVDWDTWGPRASRWFPPHTLRPPSERAVHGARMVIYTRSDAFDVSDDTTNWGVHDPATYNTPVILDFNPRPILRGATDCDHRWCRNTVVRDPWAWKIKDGDHEVTISSALPFRAFVNKEEWHHSDLQLHSTALISFKLKVV
ncbi:hypothetical protein FRC17_003169 [Serendipita sp. 399]|nr:hypothetical protein FRC17_003169 [Serendipita sp. 399]